MPWADALLNSIKLLSLALQRAKIKLLAYLCMNNSAMDLNELAAYARFLLTSPSLLDKLTVLYFEKVTESDIPFLKILLHLSQEELKEQTCSNIRELLRWMASREETAETEAALHSLEKWETGNLGKVPTEKLVLKDIIRMYDLRRSVLLHFLPNYTTDIKQFVNIVQQLGTLFNHLREKVIQMVVDLQQEKIYREKEFSTSLINNSVDGIIAFDNDLNVTEFNIRLERLVSKRRADVLGRNIFEIFPQYLQTEEGQALRSVLKGKKVFISERPLLPKLERYFEANITPLYNREHIIVGGLAIIHETTHRKEAEELIQQKNSALANTLKELRTTGEKLQQINTELEYRVAARTSELVERENFLNSIIEQSPVSTWISDTEGTLIHANKASLQLFNLSDPSAVIGQYNILQDDALLNNPYHEQIEAAFKEGTIERFALDFDLGNIQNDTSLTTSAASLICTIFPIKDKEGRITNVVIQHEDITEMKRAEEAAKQSDEQLLLITDALPVLISYIDLDKKFRFVNQEYERWYQMPREAILGRFMWEIMGDKPYRNIEELIQNAIKGETIQAETLQDYASPIGKKYISATFIPHVVNRRVKGIFAMVHDISDRKKSDQLMADLYEEANQRNEELKRINTDLDNFVYMASHDLKSPIANLEGLLSLISREVKPKVQEREGKLIDFMGVSITKLKTTIEDLLDITRIQKGVYQQVSEELAFREIVQDVKEDLLPLIEKSKSQIRENYGVETILYPKSHLRSIMYNLLTNALKYKSPDRACIIEIETSMYQEGIMLRIKDNGLGMTPVQQSKLFNMFSRMHTHVEGTGIGLYTIKRIIENKGGDISVTSEAHKGTEFKIYFNQAQ